MFIPIEFNHTNTSPMVESAVLRNSSDLVDIKLGSFKCKVLIDREKNNRWFSILEHNLLL